MLNSLNLGRANVVLGSKFLIEAVSAVESASQILTSNIVGEPPRPTEVRSKSPFDYYTNLDVVVESTIAKSIRERFPDHGIFGEERTRENLGSNHVWYIDPIDGTRNLISGRADFAVSLALYHEQRPVLGVIGMPCRGLTIAAHHEVEGLLVNEVPAPAKLDGASLSNAIVAVSGDLRRNGPGFRTKFLDIMNSLVPEVEAFRITGALAYDLAGMALGEISARISLQCKEVDVAASAFIAEHAGAVVTDMQGQPWSLQSKTILAASSRSLHDSLKRTLRHQGPRA